MYIRYHFAQALKENNVKQNRKTHETVMSCHTERKEIVQQLDSFQEKERADDGVVGDLFEA